MTQQEREVHRKAGKIILRPRRMPKTNQWEITHCVFPNFQGWSFKLFYTEDEAQAHINYRVTQEPAIFISDK